MGAEYSKEGASNSPAAVNPLPAAAPPCKDSWSARKERPNIAGEDLESLTEISDTESRAKFQESKEARSDSEEPVIIDTEAERVIWIETESVSHPPTDKKHSQFAADTKLSAAKEHKETEKDLEGPVVIIEKETLRQVVAAVKEEDTTQFKPIALERIERERETKESSSIMSSQKKVTDHQAAIKCLSVMQNAFGNNSWPSKADALNEFIKKHAKSASNDDFAVWVRQRQRSNAKISNIRKCLLQPLVHMGAITKDKSRINWNRQKVNGILSVSHTSRSNSNEQKTEAASAYSAIVIAPTCTVAGVSLIETIGQLDALKDTLPFNRSGTAGSDKVVVAVDCEGVPEDLFLIQVGTKTVTFVFDCVKLGAKVVCEFLGDMLLDKNVTKLFHDLHNDAAAVAEIGGISPLLGTIDTQLAMEFLTGETHVGFNHLLQHLGQEQHATKKFMQSQMKNKELFLQRPLPPDVLQYAADDVRLLLGTYEKLCKRLGRTWDAIQRASDLRARMAAGTGGARHICFDVPNSYALASYELLFVMRPKDMLNPTPLEVSNETDTLLMMLPTDLSDVLHDYTHKLSDVVLDKGRRPHAWIGGDRLLLGDENRLVEQDEINAVVEKLGGFGSDNRAGLERQLHRISAIRNRESEIIGLTLRFGRHVSGNTGIISDLLSRDPTKSILFLGEPGAG